jgi:hypothetical protein
LRASGLGTSNYENNDRRKTIIMATSTGKAVEEPFNSAATDEMPTDGTGKLCPTKIRQS